MNKTEAIRLLINAVREHMSTLPVRRQIALYDAMAVVLPTRAEREKSAHMSWLLTESERHQNELFTDLFQELSWPGHEHNGEADPNGGGK